MKKTLKFVGLIFTLVFIFGLSVPVVSAEPASRSIKIYYANGDWGFTPVDVVVSSGDSGYLEALNALVKGKDLPNDCANEFPAGTKVNSFKIENGVAYVDINKDMVTKLREKKLVTDIDKSILIKNILSLDEGITDVVFSFDGGNDKDFGKVNKADYTKKNSQTEVVTEEVNNIKIVTPEQLQGLVKSNKKGTVSATATAKICVDPGHGGAKPGAVGKIGTTEYYEKTVNLGIGKALQTALINNNFSVIMTRTTDIDVSLSARASIANNNACNVFVSIHCNSVADPTPRGTTVEAAIPHDATQSLTLAGLVQQYVLSGTSLTKYKDPYPADEQVLRETTMPAILTETGFMSNSTDLSYLITSSAQTAIGKAICNGITYWYLV